MAEVNYPVHLYKNLYAPRYATTAKQRDDMIHAGWTDVRANIGPQQYPKILYAPNGDTVTVGDYDRDGQIDVSLAEVTEKRLIAEGYSLKAVAKAEAVEPLTRMAETSKVSELEVSIKAISQDMLLLKAIIMSLVSPSAVAVASTPERVEIEGGEYYESPAPQETSARGPGRPRKEHVGG